MRKNLVLSLLAALAFTVQAQSLPAVVGVHLVSYHVEKSGSSDPGDMGWNNKNPGLYARWGNGLTVGAYRNSLYRNSAYLGWTFSDAIDRFAITLGAVSGYDKITDGPGDYQAVRCDSANGCRTVNLKSVILPLLVPSVRLGITERFSARLSLLAVPKQPAAVHLSVEWRL
jgi:hypothetical protein